MGRPALGLWAFRVVIGSMIVSLLPPMARQAMRDFHWIAVAALEAEPDSTLLEQLKASANKWRKR